MDLTLCAPWVEPDALRPDDDCTPCSKVTDDTPSDQILEAACLDASQFLWKMTGHRYGGICTLEGDDAVRPCIGRCGCAPLAYGPLAPESSWPLDCGCGLGHDTCCGPLGVTLGVSPVVEVTEVRLAGEVFEAWTLVGDVLARTDGQRWPSCQDLTAPTFEVDVRWGVAPPSLGERAARDLACVLVSADCGDASCTEVSNVVRKTGGGMTVEIQSPVGDLVRTLPRSVRLFLDAEAPAIPPPSAAKLRRPAVGHRIATTVGRGCC